MEKINRRAGIFKNVETIVIMALFVALSIVFGKLLAINVTSNFRISLENTPILLAAVAYGPLAGAVGYSINPIITAGAVIIGLLAGLLRKFLPRGGSGMRSYLRFLLIVSAAHLTGSVIIKTLGLYFYFGSPLLFTFAVRLGIYAVTAIIESVILYILYTRKIIAKFKPQPARRQKENDQNEL